MSEEAKKTPLLRRLAQRIRGAETPPDREIFLCTGPDCCRREAGLAAWKHLQQRLKQEGLSGSVSAKRTPCMNVCGEGPIAVVYPERTFYSNMDERGLDAVIGTDLKSGDRVGRYAFEPPDDVQEPPHRQHDRR